MQNSINIFKKSFNIVKDSPFITLYFVIYLIIASLIIHSILTSKNFALAITIGALLILLTCAFTAGWFGMIKTSVALYEENKTPEQKLDEAIKLKDSFFSSVACYILPIIAGTTIFILLSYLQSYISDLIFGKISDILTELPKFANDPNGIGNYFATLPEDKWIKILQKGIFSYITLSFTVLYMLFYSASLYLNSKCSLNPLRAAYDAIKTMISKPVGTFLAFVFLVITNIVLMFLYALFIENVIISFITMILRIYFAAYIVVLIFALYENKAYETNKNKPEAEQKPAIDCNNGPDSIG